MKTENTARFAGIFVMMAIVILIAILTFYAAAPNRIETEYGKARGAATTSVNGTSVFLEMFRQAGAKVRIGLRLSSRISKSDTLVWTPNSFELPSNEEVTYLEKEFLQLDDYRERTLIYVARDYEAAIEYWKLQATEDEGSEEYIESLRQRARSQSDHAYLRSLTGKKPKCKWFSIDNQESFFTVTPSEGTWSGELDADKVDLAVSGILAPAKKTNKNSFGYANKILLGSAETPLILEISDSNNWPNAKVLVVLNGSSLLNYPLVNHENRKIASKIIEHCKNPAKVTFLESGPVGLPISQSDSNDYSGFEALTVWPISAILLHLIAAGILFCFMVFPIFGRPKEFVSDTPNDFRKHINAIQELFILSKNRQAAIAKVNQYRQLAEQDPTLKRPTEKTESGNPFKVSQI